MRKLALLFFVSAFSPFSSDGEGDVNSISVQPFNSKQDYLITDIKVQGNKYSDSEFIIEASGLRKYKFINIGKGALQDAARNIIEHDMVNDISISVDNIRDDSLEVILQVTEYPRFQRLLVEGLSQDLQKIIRKKLNILPDTVLSRDFVQAQKKKIEEVLKKEHIYISNIVHHIDAEDGHVTLVIRVDEKNPKKIGKIIIKGAQNQEKIKSQIKHNREKPNLAILKNLSKALMRKGIIKSITLPISLKDVLSFIKNQMVFTFSDLKKDKIDADVAVIKEVLKSEGYLDVEIIRTKIFENEKSPYANILFEIKSYDKYYIDRVTFSGNKVFSSAILNAIINLKRGDVYNKSLVNERISSMVAESSIAALYYSRGYLEYRAEIIEKSIKDDKVSLEIRIKEGEIYKIGKIEAKKNTLTHDNIILRESTLLPGENFDGTKLARTLRDLSMLQLFDNNVLQQPGIVPDQSEKNKVNIIYNIKETPRVGVNFNARMEESVGVAYGFDFSTNNASFMDIFRKKLPLGSNQNIAISSLFNKDGHKHSIFFLDPMISEKRPHALSLNIFMSENKVYDYIDENEEEKFESELKNASEKDTEDYLKRRKRLGKKSVFGLGIGWGKKLSFIDFTNLKVDFAYKNINYNGKYSFFDNEKIIKGNISNISMGVTVAKDTRDSQIFPKSGHSLSVIFSFTPPYSLFSKSPNRKKHQDIKNIKYMEYHQTMVDFSYHNRVVGNIIANLKLHAGFLGSYGSYIGPFERFSMGGTESYKSRGVLSLEHIRLRGYKDDDLTPESKKSKYSGGVVFQKAVFELQYPIFESSLLHLSMHSFIEYGNCWAEYKNFSILDLKGAVGFGFRAFIGLIMNTTVGLDFGYPLNAGKKKDDSFLAQFSLGVGR